MTLREKYGNLNPKNRSVNETLYGCLEALPLASAERIARKMQHVWTHNPPEAEHLFYEAMAGAFLAREGGLPVEYEKAWHGKTPDWTVLNADGSPLAILEVSTHHLDQKQSDGIAEAMQRGDVGVAWPDNVRRLYLRFVGKADAYNILVRRDQMPYVIAVLGHFIAAVTYDEVEQALTGEPRPGSLSFFAAHPEVAGAYFFTESGRDRKYEFIYIPNPQASYPISLPSGAWWYGDPVAPKDTIAAG